jgi:hypothetical protein
MAVSRVTGSRVYPVADATEPPEQFSAFIAAEIPRWARLVQASGAKLD